MSDGRSDLEAINSEPCPFCGTFGVAIKRYMAEVPLFYEVCIEVNGQVVRRIPVEIDLARWLYPRPDCWDKYPEARVVCQVCGAGGPAAADDNGAVLAWERRAKGGA